VREGRSYCEKAALCPEGAPDAGGRPVDNDKLAIFVIGRPHAGGHPLCDGASYAGGVPCAGGAPPCGRGSLCVARPVALCARARCAASSAPRTGRGTSGSLRSASAFLCAGARGRAPLARSSRR